ncbi:MAG TPA: hypothetical protein VMV46_15540 [Thermoanaerobaculia bacterium]|nr:hypothetical protein [Thermoanaerobaculia bacterium]
MTRLELILLAFCLASGLVRLLGWVGAIDLRGRLALGLYPLYILAAALGWLSGNVFVARRRRGAASGWMLAVYFVGPLAPLLLLRAMAPWAQQQAAPLVPLFAVGVFAVFFLVPWSLRSTAPARRDLRLFQRDEDGRER